MAAPIETGPRAAPRRYQSYTRNPLGVVAGRGDELGIAALSARMIVPDRAQRPVSVGTGVKAMLVTGLGVVKRARALTPPFVAGPPLARGVGPGLQAEPLPEEGLGRPLDAWYDMA